MRDAFDELTKKKVTVFGVSTDPVETQKKFAEKHGLSYDLIADTEGKVAGAYQVPLRVGGKFASRSAFLFRGGKLVWKDLKGATETQGGDVLKIIEGE